VQIADVHKKLRYDWFILFIILILAHCFEHGFGVFGGDAEENPGGSGGLAAALFPVAQCGGADAEGGRELCLA
jgi:hypothetical protein